MEDRIARIHSSMIIILIISCIAQLSNVFANNKVYSKSEKEREREIEIKKLNEIKIEK